MAGGSADAAECSNIEGGSRRCTIGSVVSADVREEAAENEKRKTQRKDARKQRRKERKEKRIRYSCHYNSTHFLI
jgi:hypothetical protein